MINQQNKKNKERKTMKPIELIIIRRDFTELGLEIYTRGEIERAVNTLKWGPFRTSDLPPDQEEAFELVISGCGIPRSKITRMALHGVIKESHKFYGLDVDYANARVLVYIADSGPSCCPVAMDVYEK